jgi:hypothetical protein
MKAQNTLRIVREAKTLHGVACLVGLVLLLSIAWGQCPPGQDCPPGCYPAEVIGFSGQCGSIGVFPNQRCCITIYLQVACRTNPDCTGHLCGTALIPILRFGRGGGCSGGLPMPLTCGDVSYSPGGNHICTSSGCIEIFYPVPNCLGIPAPDPRIRYV